jgi:predicted ATP-dependent serine protease
MVATLNDSSDDKSSSDEPRIPLGNDLAWLDQMFHGLRPGSANLFTGIPGGGKSRITNQIVLAAATQGIRTVCLMNEERVERLDRRLELMTSKWPRKKAKAALAQIARTDEPIDLERLPNFFANNIINPKGRFAGAEIVLIDSIQGDGVAPNSAKYARFYEACRLLSGAGKTVLAISQITKRGTLAGPRGLEHFADVICRVEKVANYRICATVKNRFGEEKSGGIVLVTDPKTINLLPSPHMTPVLGQCRTFLGSSIGGVEIQAAVGLPMPGTRPQVLAPGLPRRRVEQLVGSISKLPLLSIDQFDLNINALLPGEASFRSWLGLPLAVALIASVIRHRVPADCIIVGEVDLSRSLRQLPEAVADALAAAIGEANLECGGRLIIPRASVYRVPSSSSITVIGCATLDEVVERLWPDLH